jgi:hypothetical protein
MFSAAKLSATIFKVLRARDFMLEDGVVKVKEEGSRQVDDC